MRDLNDKYEKIVRERFEENIVSGNAAVKYIENSTAIYKGEPVPCLYMPKIFSAKACNYLKEAVSTVCTILDKVMTRYLQDANYRKLFPFSPALEELILLEAGYEKLLPIARLDIFFNEEDYSFKFCEFNADGSSAMNEDRELNLALRNCDAFLRMQKEYNLTSFELFDSWVREFMDIYQTYNNKVSSPRVLITDFFEQKYGVPNEFMEFQKSFQKAGFDCTICDIRELRHESGVLLTPCGGKVDAVYRRAVTRDIMLNIESVSAFLDAARNNAICIIGHFRTQIIHNKSVFMVLHNSETAEFLTADERDYIKRHIPETLRLADGNFDLDEIVANKDEWLIKPDDYYASRGVYAGIDMDKDSWRGAVMDCCGKSYLLQRYTMPYRSVNIDFNSNPRPDFGTYNNILGMFVYNGKLAGFYSRAGRQGIISGLTGGLSLASVAAVRQAHFAAST